MNPQQAEFVDEYTRGQFDADNGVYDNYNNTEAYDRGYADHKDGEHKEHSKRY